MNEDAIAQFAGITGSTPAIAAQYLRLADDNTEQAIELFFANDGADLEPSSAPPVSSRPLPIPSSSTRPPGHRRGYEDEAGVVHIDSDQEDEDFVDDGDDVEMTGQTSSRGPALGRSTSALQTPSSATPPNGFSRTVDDDEAMARRMQEEIYGAAGMGAGGRVNEALDEHGYRAPLARTTETLVGPDAFDPSNADEMRAAVMQQMAARRQQPRHRGIFNQATTPSIWNEGGGGPESHREQLAQATGGASEASSKSSLLAEMYRPPFELMSRLPWDQARQQGKDGEKWILVNIQDPSIFDCQLLNRDIWKNTGVMETIRENFIFMQYSKDDPKGNQYVQYYFQNKDSSDAYPHIAIVDPRTGEQVKVWSGPPAPKAMDFLMQLHEFLDRYSLKVTARNPVAKRKPEPKKETQVERMTEEQMMEMALQASLAGTEARRDSDPDELTRSVDNVGGASTDSKEVSAPVHTNGSSAGIVSAFHTITSSNHHTEPAADPASTTRIQFRHPTGRVVRRFALTDPVRRIYEWLKASPIEGKQGAEFELIFMQRNLIGALDDTIEQAGLKNGTVMVEYIDNDQA
ncbi:UBX domain-containing protein 7, partial [Lecanoromycetidae sp. Uapishka_2]